MKGKLLPLILSSCLLISCDFNDIFNKIIDIFDPSESLSENVSESDSFIETISDLLTDIISESLSDSESNSEIPQSIYSDADYQLLIDIFGFALPEVMASYTIDNQLSADYKYFNIYYEDPNNYETQFTDFVDSLKGLMRYKYAAKDSYGDLWEYFRCDNFDVQVGLYELEGHNYIDLYAYPVCTYSDLDALLIKSFGETIPHFADGIDFRFDDWFNDYQIINIYTYDYDEEGWNNYLKELDTAFPNHEEYYDADVDMEGIYYYGENYMLDICTYFTGELVTRSIYVEMPEEIIDPDTSKITLTSESLDLGNYGTNLSKVSNGIEFKTTNLGDYGYGMQFKKSSGSIWNVTKLNNISGVKLECTNGTGNKSVSYAFEIEYSNFSNFSQAYSDYINISNGVYSYTSTANGKYSYVRITNTSSNALYLASIDIYCNDSQIDVTGDGNLSSYDDEIVKRTSAGLPSGTNGIYTVNFKNAKYVDKNVDYNYEYGCPSVGNPKILVVGVDFTDYPATNLKYSIEDIKNVFLPQKKTGYSKNLVSVADYYSISSYGKLNVEFDVYDEWFRPSHSSSYYKDFVFDYYGTDYECGEQVIMNELLDYLSNTKGIDLSQYDSDDNEIIDGIIMVPSVEIGDDIFNWAFTYWNMYLDSNDDYYYYNGVSADCYIWAPFQFLHESETDYDLSNPLNSFTFIHEFGHMLGASDYYDTEDAEADDPVHGWDMMSGVFKDHSIYTKCYYGWIDTSRVILDAGTYNLESSLIKGDSLILAADFDPTLGIFQDYYLLEYYRYDGLNKSYNNDVYKDCVLLYHINAFLYDGEDEYGKFYEVYNTNTSSGDYGTLDNLIELVGTYDVNDGITEALKDDYNKDIPFTFKVLSLDNNQAVIQFFDLEN